MLRIDDIKTYISKIFDMGIVDIYIHILNQGYEYMFNEILEGINLILANST